MIFNFGGDHIQKFNSVLRRVTLSLSRDISLSPTLGIKGP